MESARAKYGGRHERVCATVEGQTTAHYITDQLAGSGAKVTRLATASLSAASLTISTTAR